MTKAFVFAFLVAFLAVASAQSFVGSWTDSLASDGYGETLYFCEPDANNYMSGVYSEVGVVRGTLSNGGQTFNGMWYEGGDENIWGDFTLFLADDGDSFSGTWAYGDDPSTRFDWDETRKSDDEPTYKECLYLNTAFDRESESLEAQWHNDVTFERVHICDGANGQFPASWDFGTAGTTTGANVNNNYMGTWLQTSYEVSSFGTDLWVQYGEGQMANIWWSSVGIEDVPNYIHNDNEHGIILFNKASRTSSDKCLRNYLDIKNDPIDPIEEQIAIEFRSGASSLVVPTMVVGGAAAVVAALV